MFLENGKSIVKQRLQMFEDIAKRNYQGASSNNKTRTSLQNLLDLDDGINLGIDNEMPDCIHEEEEEIMEYEFRQSDEVINDKSFEKSEENLQITETINEHLFYQAPEHKTVENNFLGSLSLPENLHEIGREEPFLVIPKSNEDKIWVQIGYTIKELHKTEEAYLVSLKTGMLNTASLIIKDLRTIINEIYEFHKTIFYPQLKLCETDPGEIAKLFIKSIHDHKFHLYLTFGLSLPELHLICNYRRSFFDFRQMKKTIDHHLQLCMEYVKYPMKRLPQYLLLIQSMVKKLEQLKNPHSAESLVSCMKAEKEIAHLITLMDRALDFKNVFFEKKHYLMDITDHGDLLNIENFDILEGGKSYAYQGKIFLFERVLIYTKYSLIRKKYVYQGHFKCAHLSIRCDSLNRIYARSKNSKIGEIQFCGKENNFNKWIADIRRAVHISSVC